MESGFGYSTDLDVFGTVYPIRTNRIIHDNEVIKYPKIGWDGGDLFINFIVDKSEIQPCDEDKKIKLREMLNLAPVSDKNFCLT